MTTTQLIAAVRRDYHASLTVCCSDGSVDEWELALAESNLLYEKLVELREELAWLDADRAVPPG